MDKETLRTKFLGAMVGTGVGDALGASFEGRWQVEKSEIYASAEHREVLSYTDDTHMMIGMAESLIANKGFAGEHMARRFMENFYREPFRGYGPGPPRIFLMITAGDAWDKASEKLYPGGSYGNGSAMRIAPIGLFYHDDLPMLKEVAYQSSHITHAHILGKEGAALQAYAVALAANISPSSAFKQDAFLKKLNDFEGHEVYKQKLRKMEELRGEADKTKVASELGNGIEAFNSVPAAIFSFLSHPQSFAEAVVYAISLGGDTDTVGAMAGATSGAYLGIEAIPENWKTKLENRSYIEGLAERLWQIKAQATKGGS